MSPRYREATSALSRAATSSRETVACVVHELQVGRTKKCRERASSKAGFNDVEHGVDRRHRRLRREGQPVEHFVRDAGGAKRVGREIQIRQRLFENDGVRARVPQASAGRGDEFFLPVSKSKPARVLRIGVALSGIYAIPTAKGREQRRSHSRHGTEEIGRLDLIESRPPAMNAFVHARCERRIRAHEIECFEIRHS